MRRLLVLFMICLLPLRGWAGDLMGIEMSLQAAVGTVGAHAAPHMPPNCLMHVASDAASSTAGPSAGKAAMAGPGDAGHPSSGSTDGCNACDLCLPIAQMAAAPGSVGHFAGHVQSAARGPASLSASPAPTIKPPIS
ncbi:MAG: hypothetical protein RLZZ618_4303 [Pseudomonadota bacterium]|jgi:hypothetical protein